MMDSKPIGFSWQLSGRAKIFRRAHMGCDLAVNQMRKHTEFDSLLLSQIYALVAQVV